MRENYGLRLMWIITLASYVAFSLVANGQAGPSGLQQLEKRMTKNEESAFIEVARLPVVVVGPVLLGYVGDIADESRALRARETLRSMPGFTEYMKGRLLEKRSRPGGEYEMTEFQMLAAIGGREAEAGIAAFLFVDDIPVFSNSDYSAGPINHMAMWTLINMSLPDAPAGRVYENYTATDIEGWKAWAVRKGYKDESIKPLMTLEEKGVAPATIAISEAAWKSVLEFTNANTPREKEQRVDVVPSPSARAATEPHSDEGNRRSKSPSKD